MNPSRANQSSDHDLGHESDRNSRGQEGSESRSQGGAQREDHDRGGQVGGPGAPVDVDALFGLAERAADAAGAILMKHFGRATIEFKGVVNLVTNADKEAEAEIIRLIQKAHPDHGIVAEETGEQAARSAVRWIIDPIDGTTNYAHGLPVFAVSIGVEVNGEIAAGVIYNPATGEKFTAIRGRGAQRNGEPIKVSNVKELEHSLLVTGFPYTVRETRLNNIDHFENFIYTAQALRRLGSAALDMAYVALGAFDGYWEPEIKPWDIAAGWLIVEEAGGRVTDMRGRPFRLGTGNILATNGLVHDEMLAVIARGKSGL